MFRQYFAIAALLSVLLAACAPGGSSQPTEHPAPTGTPAPTETPAPTPGLDEPVTGEPGDGATPEPAPWEPAPGDLSLERAPAYVEGADVLVLESFPVQIVLNLHGSLPTPCHHLRVAVAEPDARHQIAVEVYSVADPGQMCTQNIVPFEVSINLGSFASGDYTILVNGEAVGEFTS
jgi:hypothetical protein